MSATESFCINTPTVVHEIFDDEVVIIHLDSGSYYTLNASGAQVWRLLNQGATRSAIVAALTQAGTDNASAIVELLNPFLLKLQQEQLIISCPEPSSNETGSIPSLHLQAPNTLKPFQAPSIKKYTDMQDLLFLDPIHDVEETGWPNAKAV